MYTRVPEGQDPRFGTVVVAPLDERAAAAAAHGVALVIDCLGAVPVAGFRTETRRPSVGSHGWTVADLDGIVALAVPVLRAGGNVLFHCENGRSRSVVAACVTLVALGSHDPESALVAARARGGMKSRKAREGYAAWCGGRR